MAQPFCLIVLQQFLSLVSLAWAILWHLGFESSHHVSRRRSRCSRRSRGACGEEAEDGVGDGARGEEVLWPTRRRVLGHLLRPLLWVWVPQVPETHQPAQEVVLGLWLERSVSYSCSWTSWTSEWHATFLQCLSSERCFKKLMIVWVHLGCVVIILLACVHDIDLGWMQSSLTSLCTPPSWPRQVLLRWEALQISHIPIIGMQLLALHNATDFAWPNHCCCKCLNKAASMERFENHLGWLSFMLR